MRVTEMRWLYCEANDADAPSRAAVLQRIDEWWAAFLNKESAIRSLFKQHGEWDLVDWVRENLNKVDARLMWEFGPAVNSAGHRLVITPESYKHLRPLVSVILSRAPQLDGWEFYSYRLPESIEQSALAVRGRTGGDLDGFKVRVRTGEGHRIDLTYVSPTCAGPTDQQALNEAFVATEELLGEQLLDKWIGLIEVDQLPRDSSLPRLFRKPSASLLPVSRLTPTVNALLDAIRDQMHRSPLYEIDVRCPRHPWSCLERQPPEVAEDHSARKDLFVLTTGYTAMSLAAQNDRAFYSERFSRFGETFCYLKIDSVSGRRTIEEREELETAIDQALVPAKIGRTIAGGSGLRYTYIDLAVTDVRRAIQLLRSTLAGKVPIRSWILFFEPDYADEWVGLSPGTPQPPR